MKRRTLIVTDAAKADLDGIYDHIAADSSESAERFIRSFVADLQHIARIGVTGVSRDRLRPGLRMHPYGKYVVYFRIDGSRLVVVRIIHSARDIDSIELE